MIDGGDELHRGADPDKDQSYVLFGLRADVLPHLLFPVGGYRKDEVRAIAREAGLAVAEKPDSVEICFVPDNDHAAFISRAARSWRRPATSSIATATCSASTTASSSSRSASARASASAPASRRYVLEIVPETHDVVVGDREELLATALVASRVNWLIEPPTEPLACQAKIRYRHDAGAGDGDAAAGDGDGPRRFRRAAERRHAGAGGRVLRRRALARRRLDRDGNPLAGLASDGAFATATFPTATGAGDVVARTPSLARPANGLTAGFVRRNTELCRNPVAKCGHCTSDWHSQSFPP